MDDKTTMDYTFKLLTSSAKLERDKGREELKTKLFAASEEDLQEILDHIRKVEDRKEATWEEVHGYLVSTRFFIAVKFEDIGASSDKFQENALRFLNHEEFRVRVAAGDVLGEMCRQKGPQVYVEVKDIIFRLIRENLQRNCPGDISQQELVEQVSHVDAPQIFHATAGWKNLETSMKSLQAVIEGCGRKFSEFVCEPLLELLFETLSHPNRFVRETGYFVCGALVDSPANSPTAPLLVHGEKFAKVLGNGLADNWSQVRLAASMATRRFFVNILQEEWRKPFYPILLPCMCLNRYYIAEGVRIYSQETWRLLFQENGAALVQQHMDAVTEFYVSQTQADNHAVREAACSCIAELANKVESDAVRGYVPKLVEALLTCFHDESWPVRDAACVASGNFLACFNKECEMFLEQLLPLFFTNLSDNIPSVRQGAATALAKVANAYGDVVIDKLVEKICEDLPKVEKQPVVSEKIVSRYERGPGTFGVVKQVSDSEMDAHTDQTMYSCGSLAPKMKKGGCSNDGFRRAVQPWEMADGCVWLILAMSEHSQTKMANLLPLLADAAKCNHYPQHVYFLESLCKCLPGIARNIGKRLFKPKLEIFIDVVFEALDSDSALSSSAASECLTKLANYLGPNILKGRIEMYNARYLKAYDKIVITT